MLKGLALTPPVIGRIAIGRVVEKNGRRLPEKDDEFTLTSQVQNKEGWVPHPVDAQLRKEPGAKLRSIPVRLLFDDPDLSLRANYTMFDRATGRPLCVGDGESCKRVTLSGMQSLPCPSPAVCPLAQDGNCKPYGRLHVRVEADGSTEAGTAGDELGSFVFRTTGFNSIRTLSARLRYLFAVSGGLLAGLPLELRLRGK
ncbi:phage capsid protein, partial [Acidovorax facilis]